jgi:YihY family inner membrane protein
MGETSKIERPPETAPIPPPPVTRGLPYYWRGSWVFFKKMWPAIYDLSTTETYVNASAIAFNIVISVFSFTVLIGSFLVNVLYWKGGFEALFLLIRGIAPQESASLLRSLSDVTEGPGGKATVVSFALMIFSSSGIFQPVEMALNRAWGFKERGIVKQYFTYLLLTIFCAVIMLFPVALGSVYDFLLKTLFSNSLDVRVLVFKIIGPIISLPFIVILFFVIYYFVPNGKVKANQVFFTSVAMAILWVMATIVFRFALPLFDFKGSYKRLADLMALITWIFISSFILILGANLSVSNILPKSWTGLLPFRLNKDQINKAQTSIQK